MSRDLSGWRSRGAGRRQLAGLIGMVAALVLSAGGSVAEEPTAGADLAEQTAQYKAEMPKTIIALQQFRQSESRVAERSKGGRGKATLINLSPRSNAWFVLQLEWENGARAAYHLENPDPKGQTLHLSGVELHGVRITSGEHHFDCDLWSDGVANPLVAAQRSALPYASLCNGHLFLRNRVAGHFTDLERATEFLRDYAWGSEGIIGFVRSEFYWDHFLETGRPAANPAPDLREPAHPERPWPASLSASAINRLVVPGDLGIDLSRPVGSLVAGQWYPVGGLPGIYVSFLQPKTISQDILDSHRDTVNGLDSVEAGALDYLIAFDLSAFDLGFALGTDHPRVDWSDRIPNASRNGLPGPDGIATTAPLVTNGMVSPALTAEIVATFTGGFKRQHGAFRFGAFATLNHGSHYGFIEQGTVFSKLVPGLSTLYVLDDGTVDIKTWTAQDDALLSQIRYARQNGVPLIEYDRGAGLSAPGSLVNRWGPGNWSGSAEEQLRSLRAGLCLEETQSKRFLIYGYFSTATPSAMARVFQAYRCRYAMHLDMNALEHTYLALYKPSGSKRIIEHLVQGMEVLDKESNGTIFGRFLGFPDNRDFFYLSRRDAPR
jgi:hypothetical protein